MPRPNILFVTHRVPYPPDKGDRIRTFHLLKFLSVLGNVYLASLADEEVPESSLTKLRSYCERVAVVPVYCARWIRGLLSLARGSTLTEGVFRAPALARLVKGWGSDIHFDVAIASSSGVAPYLRMPELADVPAIVDFIDVDSQKWFDYAEQSLPPKSWLYRLEGRRLRNAEVAVTRWAKAATLVSASEVNLFRRFCTGGEVEAICNGVDLDYFQPMRPTDAEQGSVFVGALDYRPNIDAVCWFCQTVWPAIRERRPNERFQIVGRRPAKIVERLYKIPGVEVIGQVADVRPYVAGAAVVVAPLRIARGLQNKVLEALAMGKAIVASRPALAGFQPGTEVPAVAATQPEEWVQAVCRLLDDPAERQQRGQAGRHYAQRYHDWNSCLEPLIEVLGLKELATAGASI